MFVNYKAIKILLCIGVCILFAASDTIAASQDGLLLDLRFDGCQVVDSSGNGNQFAVKGSGSTSCIDGPHGNAYYFDKTYLELINNISLFNFNVTTQNFTIAGWVRADNGFSRYTTDKIFPIFCTRKYGLWTKHALIQDDPYPALYYFIDWESLLGQWHHYAVVYDVVGSVGTFKMYLDGLFVGSTTQTIYNNDYAYMSPTVAYSTHHDGITAQGAVERLVVYNRALSADEILDVYSSGSIFSRTSLVGAIDLDETGINYTKKKVELKFKNIVKFETSESCYYRIDFISNSNLLCSYSSNDVNEVSGYGCDISEIGDNAIIGIDVKRIVLQQDPDPSVPEKQEIVTSLLTVNVIYDQVSNKSGNAVVASKLLRDTKIDMDDMNNNMPVFYENTKYVSSMAYEDDFFKFQAGQQISHRIIDFDKILGKGINTTWDSCGYANQQKINSRIPIVLIHGWQGGELWSTMDSRQLSNMLLWENSELKYWQHFLDYYLMSQDMQKKFHIYLYRYMSFKHVPFNAWQLWKLLSQLNSSESDIGKGLRAGNIIFLAHSMGGLVARSLIEEYGFDSFAKFIMLDTPHHGSPVSDDDFVGNVFKDLGTQGAADLNWDNVDGRDSDQDIDDNNANNRWAHINTKEYDAYYWSLLEGWVGSFQASRHHTKNPWLRLMNLRFSETYEYYKSRYVLYVAAMSNMAGDLFDAIDDWKFDIANATMANTKHYLNGGAGPTGGAYLSGFDTSFSRYEYFMPNESFRSEDVDLLTIVNPNISILGGEKPLFVISDGVEHPFKLPYRVFVDYDHEKIANGCYKGDSKGVWDKYIQESKILDTDTTGDTGFRSKENFSLYTGTMFMYLYGTTLAGATNLNPLYYEPVFNMLKSDMMNVSNVMKKNKFLNPGVQLLLQN